MCFFAGCSTTNTVNIDYSDVSEINYNNYVVQNKIDIKDNILAVITSNITNDELWIYRDKSNIKSISSNQISQCQVDKQGVYYVSDKSLYFYDIDNDETINCVEGVHSFILLDDVIAYNTFDSEIKFIDKNFNEVFHVSDAFLGAVSNDYVYYTDLDDVLYSVSIDDFEIEELVTLDIYVQPCEMNIVGNKLVMNQDDCFLI
ncbi:MAG: hypothetical protein Q4A12_07755, partial [Eubacteriales bacterium]|nr:hypothetical protein [Eubacteriales bacterium]